MSIARQIHTAFYAAVLLCLVGCSTPIKTYYAHSEAILGTRYGFLGDNGLYHDVLYAPDVISLSFDGYIVGLDKSPRERIGYPSTGDIYRDQTQSGMTKVVSRLKNEPKSHYVSQVVWNTGKPFGDGNCFLHSVYSYKPIDHSFPSALTPLAIPCGEKLENQPEPDPGMVFLDSFKAIEKLSSHIQTRLKSGTRYTHVLFAVMGWNTPQIEAVRNFNSIATNIRRASGVNENFNPLFIGVTWSSYWDQNWFDALIRLASYPNKANDADEIGASWLGLLIERISEVTPGIPKVAIGHSFGARAASMAVCMGSQFNMAVAPQTQQVASAVSVTPIDLFIALQPAVSINRFLKGGGWDEIEYPESCSRAKRIVVTASSSDDAVKSAFWADMAGAEKTWRDVCENKRSKFKESPACLTAEASGKTNVESVSVPEHFVYVDASPLVFFEHPNTGGGAHSDIYRPETGAFAWQWFPLMLPH